mgnify:CR=1 FL=1
MYGITYNKIQFLMNVNDIVQIPCYGMKYSTLTKLYGNNE